MNDALIGCHLSVIGFPAEKVMNDKLLFLFLCYHSSPLTHCSVILPSKTNHLKLWSQCDGSAGSVRKEEESGTLSLLSTTHKWLSWRSAE